MRGSLCILVFPCGSEVALEVYRSVCYSRHFHLIGASSVADHGRFVYQDYIGGLPFHTEPGFIDALCRIIRDKKVDAIYPAMDLVARILKSHEEELGCRVIGSNKETTAICASKIATYTVLADVVPCPRWSKSVEGVDSYPVFIKPDVGYGSRGVYLAQDAKEAGAFARHNGKQKLVFCEWLPGHEYTIDCFSDQRSKLLFVGARLRKRIANGISVSTVETDDHQDQFRQAAEQINTILCPRGAWFFQMKEDYEGNPKLLEVAARLSGSSSYFRAKGVNFALLSCFDALEYPVEIQSNSYHVQLDRALNTRYEIDIEYDTVYVDFDDCLVLDGRVNTVLISFLYQALNLGKRLVLLTRHQYCVKNSLKRYRLGHLFDEVVHLQSGEPKSSLVSSQKSIFIDDSHAERAEVANACGVPVFSPDMVEMLRRTE